MVAAAVPTNTPSLFDLADKALGAWQAVEQTKLNNRILEAQAEQELEKKRTEFLRNANIETDPLGDTLRDTFNNPTNRLLLGVAALLGVVLVAKKAS